MADIGSLKTVLGGARVRARRDDKLVDWWVRCTYYVKVFSIWEVNSLAKVSRR